ncbi:MAG: SURF1 family protein [Legionella sp.]
MNDKKIIGLLVFKRRFIVNGYFMVLAIAIICLFVRLGFWQLERASEKKQMLLTYEMRSRQPPRAWSPNNQQPQQYQRITVQGHFLNKILLLDNQHYNHQFGYNVLSPLLLANNQVVLVDRGWLAADRTKVPFPLISVPDSIVELMGTVYFPSASFWLLGEVLEQLQPNIAIVETVDRAAISKFLHKEIYPFTIRLDKSQNFGFIREWPIIAASPGRHYGYAVQWFAMAITSLIVFLCLSFKKYEY